MFFKLFADDVSDKRVTLVQALCTCCLKEFSKCFQLQTSQKMLGASLLSECKTSFVCVVYTVSNQRIDLRDV